MAANSAAMAPGGGCKHRNHGTRFVDFDIDFDTDTDFDWVAWHPTREKTVQSPFNP